MKKLMALGFLTLLLTSSLVWSDELNSTTYVDEKPSNFFFAAALETASMTYRESNMVQAGSMNGISLVGLYRIKPDFSVSGQFTYLTGDLNYDGQLQNGTPHKSIDHYTVNDLALNGLFLTDLTYSVRTSFLFGAGRRMTVDANDPSPSD